MGGLQMLYSDEQNSQSRVCRRVRREGEGEA